MQRKYGWIIKNGEWIDAAHLKVGYQLLGSNGTWQTVDKVIINQEPLQAYNLTVADYHSYFIKGIGGSDGVWVHNDCWHALPADAKRVEDIDGLKAYQIKHPESGKTVTVIQKGTNRFETINHTATEPHFNSLSQQIDAKTGQYVANPNKTANSANSNWVSQYAKDAPSGFVTGSAKPLTNNTYFTQEATWQAPVNGARLEYKVYQQDIDLNARPRMDKGDMRTNAELMQAGVCVKKWTI